MKLVIILFLVIKKLSAQDDAYLCSAKTCSEYLDKNKCRTIPDNCHIQNSTHNGIFLPSPDPCNCCQYCLTNLKENDFCSEGESGGLVPDSICGPGLICSDGMCLKMSDPRVTKPTPACSEAQRDYDIRRQDGTLGFLEVRPNCDDDGFYQPYKCIPGQTCFCLDKNGNRIFGEIPFTSTANLILKCECSRKYYEVLKFFDDDFLYPYQHFRCTETGDYDTIQCIGNNCMCTDAQDGAPTFPTAPSVNISNISQQNLSDCFDKNRHLEGKYYYSCAEIYMDMLEEVEAYVKDGYDTVFEVEFPNCDLDGRYAPVQKGVRNTADNMKETYYFCAYPNGTQIENYESDNSTIDCKCARTSLLLPEDATEKPQCTSDGSFERVQCRRGKCYCVDSDGYQDVKKDIDITKPIEVNEDEIDKLFCYASFV